MLKLVDEFTFKAVCFPDGCFISVKSQLLKNGAVVLHCLENVCYVHTITDNFLGRHEKLFCIVWTPIRYVTLHFRDRRGAALHKSRRHNRSWMGTEALMIQYTFRSGEEAIWYSVIMALDTLSFAFQLGLYPSSFWSLTLL